MKKLLETEDKKEALELYRKVSSMLDKLGKKNIMHKNTVGNKKSKLAKYVNNLG